MQRALCFPMARVSCPVRGKYYGQADLMQTSPDPQNQVGETGDAKICGQTPLPAPRRLRCSSLAVASNQTPPYKHGIVRQRLVRYVCQTECMQRALCFPMAGVSCPVRGKYYGQADLMQTSLDPQNQVGETGHTEGCTRPAWMTDREAEMWLWQKSNMFEQSSTHRGGHSHRF